MSQSVYLWLMCIHEIYFYIHSCWLSRVKQLEIVGKLCKAIHSSTLETSHKCFCKLRISMIIFDPHHAHFGVIWKSKVHAINNCIDPDESTYLTNCLFHNVCQAFIYVCYYLKDQILPKNTRCNHDKLAG